MKFIFLLFFLSASVFAADPMTPKTKVQEILEGVHPQKGVFLTFATGIEIRAPTETIRMMSLLRDTDHIPLSGIWIENQHIRFPPSDVQTLVSLAQASGFYTMLRLPSTSRVDIQGYVGTGIEGLVFPVVETREQVKEALENSFYSAWREMGFEPDTGNLRKLSKEELHAIDSKKTVAFMIESVQGVENIQALVKEAAALATRYQIRANQIVFWLGPYDAKADYARRDVRDMPFISRGTRGPDEWWRWAIGEVSTEVKKAGFVMGGHMATATIGRELYSNFGLKMFTVAGIADSFSNPTMPSTGGTFLQAAQSDLEPLVGAACAQLLLEKKK